MLIVATCGPDSMAVAGLCVQLLPKQNAYDQAVQTCETQNLALLETPDVTTHTLVKALVEVIYSFTGVDTYLLGTIAQILNPPYRTVTETKITIKNCLLL